VVLERDRPRGTGEKAGKEGKRGRKRERNRRGLSLLELEESGVDQIGGG
jgi:hypothetical protein